MNTKTYNPCPVDTSDVELPQELLELVEAMAKNVHELWAQGRMNEGWTYGPERNDAQRITPLLVPYEDLPEEEKAYDRNTAIGTLKFIISLGFKITRDGDDLKSES